MKTFYCLACKKKFRTRKYRIVKVPYRVVAVARCPNGHNVGCFVRPMSKQEIDEINKDIESRKKELEEIELEEREEEIDKMWDNII
jgi:hypothetical protein